MDGDCRLEATERRLSTQAAEWAEIVDSKLLSGLTSSTQAAEWEELADSTCRVGGA